MIRARRRTAAGALLAVLFSLLPVLVAAGPADAGTTTVPRPDHIVIVVEENHSATSIIGNPDAPYINSLASQNASFTQSYALTHPSQPNYIALFSGSTQGVTDDSCPHSFTAPSLGDQLAAAGRTFVGYSESLPSPGYKGCFSGPYAGKHSPWINFPSLPASTNQPLTAFPADFNDLPAVSFVIPNLVNDMHDGTVAQGDAWLQSHLADYVTWAKAHNSLFVLTFDEDDNNLGNRIATVMAGERVTPGSYDETIDHYRVLRTVQDAFGLPPLGSTAAAAPILDIWNAGPTNQPPSAAFTSSCAGATCTFDASGSADPDGSLVGYTWDYGDGRTGTGATSTHTYANGGTLPVTLTVADDAGATGAVTHPVTPTGAAAPFASDAFDRTVTGGWGTADVGGRWTTTGTASGFSVAPGAGALRPAIGGTLTAMLAGTSSADTDLTTTLASDKVSTGNGLYLTAVGRRASAGNEYRARLRVTSANTVTLYLSRLVANAETAMTTATAVPGLTFAPNRQLSVRMQVTGTGPTTVRARVWPTGTAEPTTWNQSVTDATAALQGPGSVGLSGYLSSSSTNTPVVSVARFAAVGSGPTAPPANQPPVARFGSTCASLRCTFDASASSDPDGPVASYAWTFGDGTTGSGATPAHTYGAAGTYDATLTVTDGQGATGSVTHQVSVAAPPVDQPFAADSFARTLTNGWGSADLGGPWTLTGTASSFSVGGGAGTMRLPAAGRQVTATLGSAGSADTDLTFGVSVDKLSAGLYLTATGRRVSAGNEYRARIRITSANAVTVDTSKVVAGTETALTTDRAVPGLTYTAGLPLRVRVQVTGTSPTTVRAKVWPASAAEPTTWLPAGTDSTAGLQAPGGLALTTYLSSAATNAPVTARFSDLSADRTP